MPDQQPSPLLTTVSVCYKMYSIIIYLLFVDDIVIFLIAEAKLEFCRVTKELQWVKPYLSWCSSDCDCQLCQPCCWILISCWPATPLLSNPPSAHCPQIGDRIQLKMVRRDVRLTISINHWCYWRISKVTLTANKGGPWGTTANILIFYSRTSQDWSVLLRRRFLIRHHNCRTGHPSHQQLCNNPSLEWTSSRRLGGANKRPYEISMPCSSSS